VLTVKAIEGLPEVRPGDDLSALIAAAAGPVRDDDVLAIAHKIVSKAEGRIRRLADVRPQPRAIELAGQLDKVLRATRGVLICVTHHGFVCANAGVDASNVPGEDTVVLLPQDPDASARYLRARLKDLLGVSPAILITDSFGRAWRHGQVDVAIGCAGLQPSDDWRGRTDTTGRVLKATWIASADELAAAADLARTKDGALPLILIRGAGRHVTRHDGPGAGALIRPEAQDLFR